MDSEAFKAEIKHVFLLFSPVGKPLLPGVVIADVLTKTFESSGGIFEIKKAGVTIRIPPGTIPSDTIATVSIKVCSEGPFQFPENCKVVSSIYLLETNVKLLKPIEMIVSHSAKLLEENYHKMTIMTASLVPDYRGAAPLYSFRKVASDVFETGETVGRFSLARFGDFAAVAAVGQVLEGIESQIGNCSSNFSIVAVSVVLVHF